MTGSLRRRGAGSWERCVYQGTAPATGRRRYPTRTVGGSGTKAQRELADLAVVANVALGARCWHRPRPARRITSTSTHEPWPLVGAYGDPSALVANARRGRPRAAIPLARGVSLDRWMRTR